MKNKIILLAILCIAHIIQSCQAEDVNPEPDGAFDIIPTDLVYEISGEMNG